MSDIYLAAMLSALSYGVANAGNNINDIKANYINKTGEESAVHWGSNYTN